MRQDVHVIDPCSMTYTRVTLDRGDRPRQVVPGLFPDTPERHMWSGNTLPVCFFHALTCTNLSHLDLLIVLVHNVLKHAVKLLTADTREERPIQI